MSKTQTKQSFKQEPTILVLSKNETKFFPLECRFYSHINSNTHAHCMSINIMSTVILWLCVPPHVLLMLVRVGASTISYVPFLLSISLSLCQVLIWGLSPTTKSIKSIEQLIVLLPHTCNYVLYSEIFFFKCVSFHERTYLNNLALSFRQK